MKRRSSKLKRNPRAGNRTKVSERNGKASSSWSNKTAFVRAQPLNLSGPEIVARARQQGMILSLAYVHNIRSSARKVAREAVLARRAGVTRRAPEKLESDFKKLVFILGTKRASQLLSALKRSRSK